MGNVLKLFVEMKK